MDMVNCIKINNYYIQDTGLMVNHQIKHKHHNHKLHKEIQNIENSLQ